MLPNHCPVPVHDHAIDCGFVTLGYLKIIILGIVQGITELLPISSTAHMRIIPALLGWTDPGTPFSGAAQLASFFAVMLYFRRDITQALQGWATSVRTRQWASPQGRLGWSVLLGTLPVICAGLALKSVLNAPGSPLRSLSVVGGACIIMGILLLVCEARSQPKRPLSAVTLKDGFLVGCAQMFALIPGVSRSGATLTAGLALGMTRPAAAAYSFILGVPVIVLAGLHEILVLQKAHLSHEGWCILGVGLLAASLSAFLAVFGLLRYLENHSTRVFAWYRIGLGVVLLWWGLRV